MSSGYPETDRADWPAFIAEADRVYGEMWRDFDAFCRGRGAPPLGRGPSGYEFIHESPWLNLYSYPAEADYRRERPLGPTWHRLDSTVRHTDRKSTRLNSSHRT